MPPTPLPPSPHARHFVHVYQGSPNPTWPYTTMKTGALTIAEGLRAAAYYRATYPGDDVNVTVHGDDDPPSGRRITYRENIRIPDGAIDMLGEHYPIIDGGNVGPTVSFKEDEERPSFLRGFEITGGRAPGTSAGGNNGAGIFARNAAVVIAGNCIHHNTADGAGGGIYVGYSSWEYYRRLAFIISNDIFLNHAQYGGGIGIEGDSFPWRSSWPDPIVFAHSNQIRGNFADQGRTYRYGGGISVWRLPVDIEGNEIGNNRALEGRGEAYGGGICVFNEDFSGTGILGAFTEFENPFGGFWGQYSLLPVQVRIRLNHIHHNESYKGGGVAGFWFAVLKFDTNRVASNVSRTNGGGLYLTGGSVGTFGPRNFFFMNRATGNISTAGDDGFGGAIHASCQSELNFDGPDNKLSKNIANERGGGICIRHATLWTQVGSLFVIENSAVRSGSKGGGICSVIGGTIYAPCQIVNSVELEGVHVEGNYAAAGGSGIYIEKDQLNPFTGTSLGGVGVIGCIIRANKGSSGLEIRRVHDPAMVVVPQLVTNCLVDSHLEPGQIAIKIEDTLGRTDIVGTVVRNNRIGAKFAADGSFVTTSLFERNTDIQLDVAGANSATVAQNSFNGGGVSATGVLVSGTAATFAGRISSNDIVGHGTAVQSTAATTQAPHNWWGAATSPVAGGANGIVGPVDPQPVQNAAWGYVVAGPTVLPVPGDLVLPPPATVQCSDPFVTGGSGYGGYGYGHGAIGGDF